MKNAFDGLIRLDMAEERLSELEAVEVESWIEWNRILKNWEAKRTKSE